VGEGGWGRDAYLSQAHLVAKDNDAEEAVAVEEEEDAQSLPRVELVQRLADSRNPRPEMDAKVPESGGVDNVEVFHLKTVFEVSDQTVTAEGLVHSLLQLLQQFVGERAGGLGDGGEGGGHHDGIGSVTGLG
jgi:hypothetical protein